MVRSDPPVLLFDGDCAFCSSCARWMSDHIPSAAHLAAWQLTDLDALGTSARETDESVVMVDTHLHRSHGPEAIAAYLGTSTSRRWRAVGTVLGTRPVLWIAWPVYRLISRNRHRMPGGTPQCALPAHERAATAPPQERDAPG